MMEKRTYGRVEVSHPALYFSNVYPRPTAASAIDLSLGGTRIETSHSLIPGEDLKMYIAIHPQVIKCRGEVVHVSDLKDGRPKAGIRFEGLSKQDTLYLGEYISYVMEQHNGAISAIKGMMMGIGFGLWLWTGIVYAILTLI
jgi:hypothetical protein